MTQTQKYKLPQWEKADRIVMEDFNGMASKLETALTAHDTAIAGLNSGKADKSTTNSLQTQINARATTSALNSSVNSLQTQIDAKCRIICGTYTGDGAAERTISLGATPKAVLLFARDGHVAYDSYVKGGLAFPGHDIVHYAGTALTVVTGGFKVYYKLYTNTWQVQTNNNGETFHYIAFC